MAVLPGKTPAPDLRQRPLRLAEHRRQLGNNQRAGQAAARRRSGTGPRPGGGRRRDPDAGARAEAPGETGRSAAASRPELQRRRARRERRRQRDGAVDGTGARVRRERHRVRRDARVHGRRRRGAGADRRRRAREEGAATRRFRSRPGSTTTSSATRTAATASSTARRSASTRKGPRIRRRARSRSSPRGSRRRYVPSHRIRLMARRDRFSRGGDHSALNAEGFAAIGFRESQRELLEAARRRRHDRRRGLSLPRAERARERRRRWRRWRWRRRRPSSSTAARRADDRSPSVRLRCAPALGGVARRGRLSHLLARRVGARLAARARGRQRHRVHASRRRTSTTGCSAWPRWMPPATRARSASTWRARNEWQSNQKRANALSASHSALAVTLFS